ncbi:MAG: DNA polymerase III subunit gamma/tau [Phycisphaerales bacterium]
MAYTVLARRYRSQAFDELIGQEGIARTLQNAIKEDRVAHAYLFCGTRGVGKTSTARIFACALNAVDDKGKGVPDVAAAIMKGQDTDVIEIDAASNNSVDNARELIANCVYRPMRGRKKVYIIDEVHMLSPAAFNALLKTMEEPPDHVVFILCTTETHKVPATIQSRCQRFDFRPISTKLIAGHLKAVCKGEGVQAEDELLHMVARLGNGSMRDALSLLDRLIAGRDEAGGKRLTAEGLETLLGVPERSLIVGLVDAFADSDARGALEQTDALLARGVTVEQMLVSVAQHLRDLMVLRACGAKTELVDLTDDSRASAAEQSGRFDEAALTHMIALCESVGRAAKSSAFPRVLVDALVVRLAQTHNIADAVAVAEGRAPAAGAPAPAARAARPAPAGGGAPVSEPKPGPARGASDSGGGEGPLFGRSAGPKKT